MPDHQADHLLNMKHSTKNNGNPPNKFRTPAESPRTPIDQQPRTVIKVADTDDATASKNHAEAGVVKIQFKTRKTNIMITKPFQLKTNRLGRVAIVIVFLLLAGFKFPAAASQIPKGFTEHFADVNGVHLHYFIGGKGSPVVLLHGYAETSHMWLPIMPQLAETHTVIVPDLRGAGDSSKPESGYDKKNMAVDIHDLTTSLGFTHVSIVGHDIGLMVAYAYAAQFPQETDRLVLMDAFLPGVGNWKDVWLMRDLWHFHFYGKTPLALVHGRERTYFEHFWNDFAADPSHSIPEADRRLYAKAYAQPGGMRAGFEYFRNFTQDAKDFAQLSMTPLPMPVLVLTGEKASGNFLIDQAKLVATNVQGRVITGSGHWLMEEAPQIVIPALTTFLNDSQAALSQPLLNNSIACATALKPVRADQEYADLTAENMPEAIPSKSPAKFDPGFHATP